MSIRLWFTSILLFKDVDLLFSLCVALCCVGTAHVVFATLKIDPNYKPRNIDIDIFLMLLFDDS